MGPSKFSMMDVQKVDLPADVPNPQTLSDLFDESVRLFDFIEDCEHPSISLEYQTAVKKAISFLEQATHMVNQLALFSSNETIEEVATSDLKYLLLPSFLGYFTIKLVTPGTKDRLQQLSLSELYYADYISRCRSYELPFIHMPGILNEDQVNDSQSNKRQKPDLAQINANRDEKIKRYKIMKAVENEMKKLKTAMKLNDDDETKREYYITLLKNWIYKAYEELSSIKTEKTLLQDMAKLGPQAKEVKNNNNKTFKPVVIVKNQLQKQVFGIGYPSKPVMTVDEFYQQRYPDEAAAKAMAALSLQQMAVDPEVTKAEIESEKAQEEKLIEADDSLTLQHARAFDDWKDENRRGSGNRKNKG